MTLPRNQKLRQKASLAVRSGDFELALGLYRRLEELMPDDPTWPERCAGAHHELGQPEEELACLLRALEMQVDSGQVLAAIATCKLILDIEPDHPSTLDCLHLLYSEPSAGGRPPRIERPPQAAPSETVVPADADAPMVELELTNVMPGARALALGNGGPEGVTEIPLGDSVRPGRPSAPAQQSQHERRPERPPKSGRATKRRSSARDSGRESAARPVSGRSAREELARTPLFGSLEPPALHRLMSEVRVVRLAAGEVLFREGDPANALYVVVEGAVVPIAEGSTRKRMAVLEQGEFFGEIGLVTNQPRNATIEGLVDTRLLAIDRRTMWSLVRGHAEMSKVLLRFLRQRLIDRHIGTNPFFAAFARDDRSAMAGLFRFLEVKDGSAVVEQGAPSEGLFVLLAGELDVIDEVAEKHRGSLEPGDLFGGITLIGGAPATASVVANGKCWVLALSEVRFRRILKENPRLEAQLKRLASQAGGDPHLV